MDKSRLVRFSAQIKKDIVLHYGPILYLYTVETEALLGPLPTNVFLPGMHEMLCEFLNIDQELAKKICKTKDNPDFKTAKKVVILIKLNNKISDVSVLNL